MNIMTRRKREDMENIIADLHMHVVPRCDDGSVSISMSLEMLRRACSQGVRTVFCTSHGWKSEYCRNQYLIQFQKLRQQAEADNLGISLLTGNEIRFEDYTVDENIQNLRDGVLFSLNGTGYVLTEFWTDVRYPEADRIVRKILSAGWTPVIAHAERCHSLSVQEMKKITDLGCLIQINAYSLADEKKDYIRSCARELLKNQMAAFIGSDAHGTDHRPPEYTNGVKYILEHCSADYAEKILSGNAERLLIKGL